MPALLEVRNASYAYADKRLIFENVSFSIQKGDLFTILGPNGAGKSTLLNCLAHLFSLTDGKILLEGTDIDHMSPSSIARKIAYVPQNHQLAYGYSVRDYIVMGRAPHMGMFNSPKKKDYKMVDDTIEMMSLNKFAHKSVTQISGGERQQVCIARAIVQNPAIILFDEPTSSLDYGNQLRTLRVIKRLSNQGYAIIMTTHNPDQPMLLDGLAGVLSRQGEMEIGTVKEILQEDRLSELYDTKLYIAYVKEVDRLACLSESL